MLDGHDKKYTFKKLAFVLDIYLKNKILASKIYYFQLTIYEVHNKYHYFRNLRTCMFCLLQYTLLAFYVG